MSLFPTSRARIRREASDWVVRLADRASKADLAAFNRWRQADSRHAEAYDRIAAIWNQAGGLSRSSGIGDLPKEARPGRPGRMVVALAALLTAAFLVTTLLLGARWLPSAAPEQEPMLYVAAVGEIREIDLPDGSRLMIDSASKVEAEFTRDERKLALKQGRARFQVAHEARPFVVRAGPSEVVATGTLFDVSLIGGRTAVVLIEGSVEVRGVGTPPNRAGKVERLQPGQKLIVTASAAVERRQATPGDTSWSDRMLEFDNSRLDEAAAAANRYSRVQLRIGDNRIRGLRVSGAFRAGDVAGLARSLAAAFDLQIISLPDGNLLLADSGSGKLAPAR
jgi:transmembrane sensor